MNSKLKIIPIFVPHVGCRFDCVFCNQKKITGKGNIIVDKHYAINVIEECRKTLDEKTTVELAFFGGSFTAIDRQLQEELLIIGKHYKDLGVVQRIRISTRPDAINDNILELQKKYGVDIIELGIQSLDDKVLHAANRGHTREDCYNASRLIKEHNFKLGHQIMPGLPGSDREKDIQTCMESISMQPDMVRIYPTLVIKDTELLNMYEKGSYSPLKLEEAVEVSAYIYCLYMKNNINVIRIGLQNTESINECEDVVGGPFHPAFRQLVEEKIYLSMLIKILSCKDLKGEKVKIFANKKIISNLSGQNRANITTLKSMLDIKNVSFEFIDDENITEIYVEDKKIGEFYKSEIYENYLKSV